MKRSSVESDFSRDPSSFKALSFICYPRYSWAWQSLRIQLQLCPSYAGTNTKAGVRVPDALSN